MKSSLRPVPTKQVSFESMLLVGRVRLRDECDVGLMPKFVWQILHLRVDTVFVSRPIATVLLSASITVLVVAVSRYCVIEPIIQIVRHLFQHSITYDFIRIIFFGQ